MNFSLASTERSFDTSDFDSDEYNRDVEENKGNILSSRDSSYQSTNLIHSGISSVADIFIT
jgi:hypothetical protein